MLRNLHAVFPGCCTNVHSHEQCARDPFFLHPCHNLFVIYVAMSGLSCGMPRLFSNRGVQAPEHAGSLVVAHRPSFPTVCGILVPQPGIIPTSLLLEGRLLTVGPPGKSHLLSFCNNCFNRCEMSYCGIDSHFPDE